jgi:hypothetical protein
LSLLVALVGAAAITLGGMRPAVASDGSARLHQVSHVFSLSCHFSHGAPDDPILYPGRPGRSHEHTFVGNVSTNAFSIPASLRAHGTTCSRAGDASAYWAPTLYADGRPVRPNEATIYYNRLTSAPVKPLPAGLEMVAGNSHAVAPQSARVTSWDCGQLKSRFYAPRALPPPAMEGGVATGPPTSTSGTSGGFPVCPIPMNLELKVNFPDCSNGMLDSADHKSHMAYSVSGRCPASHPIALPAISLVFRYPTFVAGDVFLSSGGVYSGHADFMNGWKQSALTKLVDGCLNLRRVCGYPVEPGALN